MMEVLSNQDWFKVQISKIPKKLSFRIGEVSSLLNVKPYVLRYWELEFEELRPKKLDNNQRIYFHKDVELLFLIKKLLHKDGFSIKGAKQALKPLNRNLKKESKKVKSEKFLKERLLKEVGQLAERTAHFKKLFT